MAREDGGSRVFKAGAEGVTLEPGAEDATEQAGEALSGRTVAQMSFTTHILSLNHLALLNLGQGSGAESAHPVDLVVAAQAIDTLSMLKEKTRGNLTAEETRVLDALLYELKVTYVRVARP